MHRRLRLLGRALVAVVLATALVPAIHTRTAPAQVARPNIVMILTDDMRWDETGNMPTLKSEVIGKGTWFKQAFDVNPLCCPSRTSSLTGQYSHTTHIWNNVNGPTGGFKGFLPHESSTVATWLHGAGYRTALIGKYLNGYTEAQATHIPPGWDRWLSFVGGPNYYNYALTDQGRIKRYGTGYSAYSTDVLSASAGSFIRGVPASQPLFLWFAPYGPHAPFKPAPRYANAIPTFTGIRPPNLNEADVSDKPGWVRKLAPGGTWDSYRLSQLRTLLAVDDAIANILGALKATGRLNTTMIVFASDNGLSGNSHRWGAKETPWEEALRVPIVIRYDPMTGGVARVDKGHLVLNIDEAPTFAALAGVAAPGVEGRSLVPLLAGTPETWRTEFVIEHLSNGAQLPPTYCAVRTERYKYVRWVTGEEELYDLLADPYELRSLHRDAAYAALKAKLHADVERLCSPPPPGYTP